MRPAAEAAMGAACRTSMHAAPLTPLLRRPAAAATMADWGPSILRQVAKDREVIIFDNPAQGLSTVSGQACGVWVVLGWRMQRAVHGA